MISDKKPVQDFIQLLDQHNIREIILCPGSRNAPFSLSLAADRRFQLHSVPDERSAAFLALGMAQQLNHTVAMICTSGTATLNFAPALAEAYYQRIPLLIVTADRPLEWIDQGEGQSIRQRNVYRNYVKASYEIAEEASDGDLVWYNARIMDEAMRLAAEGVRGPVHINFPLREPLYHLVENQEQPVKMIERANAQFRLTKEEITGFQQHIAKCTKVMVLAGQMQADPSMRQAIIEFSKRKNVSVLTEAHSNLADEGFITTIDRLLAGLDESGRSNLKPELLITVGHNIISRKIKTLLRAAPLEHWHVDISGEGLDTLKKLNKVIQLTPTEFFENMNLAADTSVSDYRSTILSKNTGTEKAAKEFIGTSSWSDLQAFDIIHSAIPANSDVQMGNSSVVRYILLNDARADLRYFGNRGVAGIDGCTSTAVGAAHLTSRLTTLISGDIAFFYDSNAFWNNLNKTNLRIIVINNGGGGIFRIIDGPDATSPALSTYFETAHTRSAAGLAAMYGLAFRSAQNAPTLEQGLDWLYSQQDCAILEVSTPQLENSPILKEYFEYIRRMQG